MSKVTTRSSWQIFGDVIFALFAREIRIGFNDKLGISWAIIQPIIFILVLSFMRGRLDGGETHTMPTFMFMAYGMMFVQTFLQTFVACSTSIKKNKSLFAFRQVQPLSAVLASGLFNLLAKTFVVLGLILAIFLFSIELKAHNLLLIIVNFIALWIFSVSAGLALAIGSSFIPELDKIQQLATRPLFFISGVFFSLKDIPQEYWWLLNWNPILHAIELSRDAAYKGYDAVGVSEQYFFISVLTSVFLSLVLYQAMRRKILSK